MSMAAPSTNLSDVRGIDCPMNSALSAVFTISFPCCMTYHGSFGDAYFLIRFLSPLTIIVYNMSNKNKYCHVWFGLMAVTRMRFVGSGNGVHYLDLSKALSLQLRKLHRQKNIYTVYGGFFVDTPANPDVNSRIDINVAPNTWPVKLAINRSFKIWRKMIAKTLSNTEGMQTGKWNDFKIFLNQGHGPGPLLPRDAAGQNIYGSSPEWDYSTLTTEDPEAGAAADQFELQIVGPHVGSNPNWTRIGVVQSWVDSRAEPSTDPVVDNATTSADPLSNLFDAGDVDDERITVINAEGDNPPYDVDQMFGNSTTYATERNLMRASVAVSTTSSPVQPVHGFEALCGLVELEVTANGAWELVLDVESNGVRF